MENLIISSNAVMPMFVLMFLGYALKRLRLISPEMIPKLNKLAVHPHFTNQLVCTPFFRDPMVVVCTKDSALKKNIIRPQDLDAQYEIFWRYYGEFKLWHDQWWDQLIVPEIKIDFSIPLSFNLIKNPKNWLIAPRSVAEKQIELNSSLQIKELTNPPPDIVCYYVTRNVPEQDSAIPIKLFSSFLENNKGIFTTNPYMEI